MPQESPGPAFRFVAALIRPQLMVLTRRDWRGGEHLPAGGVVVSTNHVSNLDPLTFGHFLWDNGRVVRYLAKASVFRVPIVGRIIRACGQIPVDRGGGDAAGSFRAAVDAVRQGKCVAIYPEGTITRDPDYWPMRGKTGAARVALETGCDVVPVAQWGVQQFLPRYARRPHLLPRATVHVHAGPPVDLDDLRGRALTVDVLTEATRRIMADITVLLEGIRGETAPLERFDPRRSGLPSTGNYLRPARRTRRRGAA